MMLKMERESKEFSLLILGWLLMDVVMCERVEVRGDQDE
jgi:hypothetical protein